jgi:hypothetical protein
MQIADRRIAGTAVRFRLSTPLLSNVWRHVADHAGWTPDHPLRSARKPASRASDCHPGFGVTLVRQLFAFRCNLLLKLDELSQQGDCLCRLFECFAAHDVASCRQAERLR